MRSLLKGLRAALGLEQVQGGWKKRKGEATLSLLLNSEALFLDSQLSTNQEIASTEKKVSDIGGVEPSLSPSPIDFKERFRFIECMVKSVP